MVNLVGLKIQGIRSLSENYHYINFDDTITLIQGENGSGKTTIIEALNYAATGSLPSGKVHAFIHNNTLAQKNRVDASVQLQFTNVEGLLCTITRRMSSSIKGGKNSTKQDENTLTIQSANGLERSISSKVVDFNKEIIEHMGVSKAILENVIFCHQENAQWPLSEPKVLKNRFDSIFEVTKYVKAMDHVTKLIKDYESSIKMIDAELPYLESDRDEYVRMTTQHQDLSKKLEHLTSEISSTGLEKDKLTQELITTRNYRIEAEEVDKKVMSLRSQLSILQKQAYEMKDILDYHGSTKELEYEIEAVSSSFEIVSSKVKGKMLENQISKINEEINDIELELQNSRDELLKYEIDKRQVNGLLCDKRHLINEFENYLSIVISENDENILENVKVVKNSWDDEFDEVMRGIKFKSSDKRQALINLKNQLSEFEGKIALKREDVRTKISLISKLNKDILELKKSQIHRDTYSNKIIKLEREIKDLDESYEDTQTILEQINKTHESIDVLKNWHELLLEKEEIESSIDKKVQENGNVLRKVFTRKIPTRNSSEILKKHINLIEKSLSKNKEKLKEKDQKWFELKREITELTKSIASIEKNCNNSGNTSGESIRSINCSKEKLEKLNMDVGTNSCENCVIDDESKEKYQKLIDERRDLINYIFSEKFIEVQSVLKLPSLKEKLSDKNEIFIKCDSEKKQIQNEATKIKERLGNMRCLQKIAFELDSLNNKLEEIEENIAKTKEKYCDLRLDDSGFPNDCFMVTDVEKLLNNSKNELEQLMISLKNSGEINSLKIEQIKQLGILKERSMTVTTTKAIINNFRESIKEHEIAIKEYNGYIDNMEAQKSLVIEEISKLESELKKLEDEFEEKEKQGRSKIKELNNYISLLTNICEKLSKIDIPNDEILELATTKNKEYSENLNSLLRQRSKLELELSGLFTQQKNLKLLEEQLRKRKIANEITEIEVLISQSELKCSDLKFLIKKESSLDNRIQKLELEICAMRQSHDSLSSAIGNIQFTINKAKYSSASETYRQKAVRKVVQKKAIKDLEKYKSILDKSIISFHKTKMSEVNLVLEDLWKRVYKGNDIEAIRITSKMKDDSSKRMSYDYMVVMIVDGVEMDMRDRCSSGQKMLACILIRVALSEVFCLNCPVMALDEPTTNLDIDKVENVAEMLNELVNYRSKGLPIKPQDDCCAEQVLEYENALDMVENSKVRKYRNFQLIVITHDEHLVSLLHRNFKPNNVYRLSKDGNGISTIKAHGNIE
uniref:DNA repair protein RAD50 (inferred by orthology to a human protein) n=1 Tax=Strongyloides venezuelensis TaxID=75913 RepID=A0A0K0FAI7_STRVS